MTTRTLDAIRRPSGIDLTWAAGFLEGEGSFQWAQCLRPAVSAPQKAIEPLDRLQALFGGAIYALKNRGKDLPRWMATGERAVGIMMTIYSHMSSRRQEQIRKCLIAWQHVPPWSAGHRAALRRRTAAATAAATR